MEKLNWIKKKDFTEITNVGVGYKSAPLNCEFVIRTPVHKVMEISEHRVLLAGF
jgi:hypothetical protein